MEVLVGYEDYPIACDPPVPCMSGNNMSHPDNCSKYQDCVTGHGWLDRPCSTGTQFDMTSHKCTTGATCHPPCPSRPSEEPFTGTIPTAGGNTIFILEKLVIERRYLLYKLYFGKVFLCLTP